MSTASQQQKISALWDQVVLNSKVVRGTLEGVEDRVSSFESKVTAALFEQLNKFNPAEKLNSFKDGLAAAKEPLESVHANLYPLYNALIGFELTERDSWLEVSYELGELLLDLLPQLTDVNPGSVKELFHKIETVIDGIFDVIEVTEQFGDLSILDLIVKLRHTINTIIDGLHIFGLNDTQLLNIKKGINPILNTLTLALLNGEQLHLANDNRGYKKNNNEPEIERNETKVVPSLISESVQKNVNRHFPEIAAELKDISFVGKISFQEKEIREIWEYLVKALQPFDASDYSDVQTALFTLKWKTDSLLDYLCYNLLKNNSAATQFIESTIRPNLDQWFSLPNDFRPNNWVEITHQLVKNIQFTLNTTHSIGPIGLVKSFVQKLEALLHYVDNEDFIFLLTPKENTSIHNIQLPHILDEEEAAEAELPKHENNTETAGPEYPTEDFGKESSETNTETILTISAIIEYLFFDEKKGAVAKLSPEYVDIVYDLYYREWFKSRKEKVIGNLLSLFSKEILTDLTAEVKAMLLHENGVNLGELINFVADKGFELLNRIGTLLKETVSYVLDELFSLVKAILSFLKEADVPQEARDLLKKLPPFANMPDHVTLLHVLAAIPYTISKEFVNFNVAPQTV